MEFALNPTLDATALAKRFAEHGRLSVPEVLDPRTAEALLRSAQGRSDWLQVVNSGAKVFELSREVRAGLPESKRKALDDSVYAGARSGFQYRYETIRVPDSEKERQASDDLLARFALWWSAGEARDFLRAVTGEPGIDFADVQGTAYAPGDFLTAHDDAVAGKNRLAAYVLGLTPAWRVEWGGLLLFHEPNGTVKGMAPQFNTLNLFRVPQLHSVSEVTRAAPYRRYSITGWLRAAAGHPPPQGRASPHAQRQPAVALVDSYRRSVLHLAA